MAKSKSKAAERRIALRNEFWPEQVRTWLGPEETGFFCAPRTLPLLLTLLSSKQISGKKDIGSVYVELLSRHVGEGIVQMGLEEDHAYASGYYGTRATRTWRERMKILEEIGLIKVQGKGFRKYAYVLLVHPTLVIEKLRDEGRVSEEWWFIYRERQIETKEPSAETLKNGL